MSVHTQQLLIMPEQQPQQALHSLCKQLVTAISIALNIGCKQMKQSYTTD